MSRPLIKQKTPTRPTFLVATYISTMRCFIRRAGSAGKGVLPEVRTPTSSVQAVLDEEKVNGKNFSTIILAAKSS